jgi:toxin CptA
MSPARPAPHFPSVILSIAIAAVVRPSFCLRLLLASYGLAAAAAALMLAGPLAGATAPFRLAWAGAAVSAGAALFFCTLFVRALHPRRYVHALDISAVGQLRAAVYVGDAPAAVMVAETLTAAVAGAVGEAASALLPGSTLWSGFLLLRVRAGLGRVVALRIWPGSVAPGQFRPVAAACRAIATNQTEHLK